MPEDSTPQKMPVMAEMEEFESISEFEVKMAPPESKATNKGHKFYCKGMPLSSNPYTNEKRRNQFDNAWLTAQSWDEAESYGSPDGN